MKPKIKIHRDVVIGYIVTQEIGSHGARSYGITHVVGDHYGDFGGLRDEIIAKGSQVIGVLPAPQNTFHVGGYLEGWDDSDVEFGYEYAGADNPDWENDYVGTVTYQAMCFQLEGIIPEIADDHRGEASEELILAAAMEVSLFKEWREYDVLDAAERVHDLLVGMVITRIIESPREGVYTIKRGANDDPEHKNR
jgi:hypothetical protein